MGKRNILITGGSGYLGQHLVQQLASEFNVSYTFHSFPVELECDDEVRGFKVDFETGDGLETCFEAIGCLHAVINCAAISAITYCEQNPDNARAINIPTKLIECMHASVGGMANLPLLVHLSTDQVYDGSRPLWKEEDETKPLHIYGNSKLEAEQFIKTKWPNYVILRSSFIYGKAPQKRLSKTTFLDFIVHSLSSNKRTKFFTDEFRNPIYVADIVSIVRFFLGKASGQEHKEILNMGGPERMNRLDFALKVAAHLGLNKTCIEPALSASIERGALYPLDISMDLTKIQDIGIKLTNLDMALLQLFGPEMN